MRRGILAAVWLVGCSSPDERPPPPRAFQSHSPRAPRVDPPTPAVKPPAPPAPPVTPAPAPAPAKVPTDCASAGTVTGIEVRGGKLLACIDTNADSHPDQCVEWNRATGKVLKFESVAEVDNGPPQPAPDKPDLDPDDPRITQDTTSIEVCPEDRICVKLMPKLSDTATIDHVRADSAHHNIAIAISDGDGMNAHLEFWDITTGRMRTRTKVANLDAETNYAFTLRSFGDAMISVATRSNDQFALATLYGPDGTRKAALAGGSRYLDADQMFELAPGQLAVFDQGAPSHPYNVYVHNLANGATVAKFVVQMDDDNDDDAIMMKIDKSTLGVVQWSNELRIDVLDTRNGSDRTFKAPGC
jgi:hypothetical protein